MTRPKESWNSRFGVIMAVAGSAVGLGNFLRFPGLAAQYGGGAFMIAYAVSFVMIGLSICWAEWAMGRYGGAHGYNSSVGVMHALIGRRWGKYLGILGVLIPVGIYMYYVYVEAWCLGYAVNFLAQRVDFQTAEQAGAFFAKFTGAEGNGMAFGFGLDQVGWYLVFVFILNFFLIYRGISRGIELFCRYAMPVLIVLAVVILVRVLTLGAPDPNQPEYNINNGLGFMWNPSKTFLQERIETSNGREAWRDVRELVRPSHIAEVQAATANDPDQRVTVRPITTQLLNPQLWLAAAGQLFFSLSVGLGVILNYASYLRSRDDIVLSGLTATSANEFCEVGLGGMITIPAGYAFLGVAGLGGMTTFGLGFHALPMVFSAMPLGHIFGFLFFFLLFLAAITSSLSMLQPGIAFLEEAMGIGRKLSVSILGLITVLGVGFVVYFSENLKAMDTIDFWVGTMAIFILATIQIVVFGWVFGIDRGLAEANRGAAFPVPRAFRFIMKWVTPAFLITVFGLWVTSNVFGYDFATGQAQLSSYVTDLIGSEGKEPDKVARMSFAMIVVFTAFLCLLAANGRAYRRFPKPQTPRGS